MTGSELLIGAAAEGITALITDTTKTGSGSVLGKAIKGLKDKSSQAIFQASRKYIENYQKRHCQLKVLGMREPVDLSAVYTGVKLLDSQDVLCFEIEALEDTFRKGRFRGYSGRSRDNEKHSGITIANQKQYLMVLGGPGAGKSTFLRKVGLEALRTFYYEKAAYRHRLIPVLLELKRFDTDHLDIAKFITDEFETCGFPEAETFTQNALTQGNLLILLDGLDEVPSAQLNNVLKTIRDFIDRYDDNRFMASCRVAASGYRDDAFRRFSDVTMADFDDEQIQKFIGNWFSSTQDVERGTAAKCWEVLQKPENQASRELAHTPLLLTYLCLVYNLSQRFPRNRSNLYKKALRILLEEWAADKRILQDDIYEELSIEQEEILLSEIAYEGISADQLFFAKRELSNQIKLFLANNLNAPKHLDSEAVLNAIEVQQGILVERAADIYSFSHLTLQEYLTAQYLVDNNEWRRLIPRELLDKRWREIFLLIPGLITSKTGTDRFLLEMEKQAQTYIQSHNFIQLIEWSDNIISTENTNFPEKKIVAIWVVWALTQDDYHLSRTSTLLKSILSQPHIIERLSHIHSARKHDRYRATVGDKYGLSLALSIDLDTASYLSTINVFKDLDFGSLIRGIEILINKEKERDSYCSHYKKGAERDAHHSYIKSCFKTCDQLWFTTLSLDTATELLSEKKSKDLADYFYIYALIIRCKEGANRVSPEVWEGIESRFLTVPATSEASED